MNNRQASIIAAAAFHAGQQASLRDVEQTATSLERVLSMWDTEAREAEELVVRMSSNRTGQKKD